MNLLSLFYNILAVIIISYILFGVILFFAQKSFIYYPDNQNMTSCSNFKDYSYETKNNTRFLFKENSSASLIVFYHGNFGSVCDRSYVKGVLEKTNHSILFVEYTGYSNDSKNPSKDAILQNVQDTISFIKQKNYSKTILVGESLGSGAASYHASLVKVDNLLLITPFSSITDVAKKTYSSYPVSILVHQNFDNIKYLEKYQNNVSIFHGSNDKVIPLSLSQKLFDSIQSKSKEFYLYENYGHNNLWSSNKFEDDFLKNIK